MPAISQAEALRRGLRLAALIWTEPRRVSDLMRELELEERDVQRLIAGLREAGLDIRVEARVRERYYSLAAMPDWLERAIRTLAVRAVPRPLPSRRR